MLPHVRESGFQNPGNLPRGMWNTEVLLLEIIPESMAMESRVQLKESSCSSLHGVIMSMHYYSICNIRID